MVACFPQISILFSLISRVTPGRSKVKASRNPDILLNSVDLPTFVRPIKAILNLSDSIEFCSGVYSNYSSIDNDRSNYRIGTINVDVSPLRFAPGPEARTLRDIKWHPEMPAETFSFSAVTLCHHGVRYPALVYWPHPETKPEGFQAKGWIAEIIAPDVPQLRYGDAVTIESVPDQALWTLSDRVGEC